MEKTCCILIIEYRESLSGNAELSLLQALKIFKNRDIRLVIPNNINTEYYDSLKAQYEFEYVKVNHDWLSSISSYNKMCCKKDFYTLFGEYDYILIYQTDCWVFEDNLDYFMGLGYDWYGAPWYQPHIGLTNVVGNGGLSLRKLSKMIEMTETHRYDIINENEDTWFCKTHGNEMNICPLDVACNFSLEVMTEYYKMLIKDHPMGLHGKFLIEYWNKPEKFKQ